MIYKKYLPKVFFTSLFIFCLSLNGFGQSYDRDLPYVDPTGAYQLFSLLRYEVEPTFQKKLILDSLDKYLEVRYKYGANGNKKGIDCSALTMNIYKEALGKKIPRTAASQYKFGVTVKKKEQLRFGDLVFFKIKSKRISHVGIYIASGHFVHASSSLGVTVNNLSESYYKRYYTSSCRIVDKID